MAAYDDDIARLETVEDVYKRQEQDWLFSGEDGICTKIAFQDADTRSHNHNYYEFFLVGAGSATHHINDKKKIVNTGALVFIRPKDIHSFQNPSSDFCFYNLLVSRGRCV